jgi:hypothetical protein
MSADCRCITGEGVLLSPEIEKREIKSMGALMPECARESSPIEQTKEKLHHDIEELSAQTNRLIEKIQAVLIPATPSINKSPEGKALDKPICDTEAFLRKESSTIRSIYESLCDVIQRCQL